MYTCLSTDLTVQPWCNHVANQPSLHSAQRGLFGLGGPEVAIIAVAAAFLLGPSKLAEFSKDLGKVAGELKDVLEEMMTKPKAVRSEHEEG